MIVFLLPILLTFVPLNEFPESVGRFVGQEVEIKGFLYEGQDGWVLTDKPNLKSCCVGKCEKRIRVWGEGLVAAPDRVVTLKGILAENESGYQLSEAKLIEKEYSWLWVLLLGSGFGVGYAIYRSKAC